LKTPGWIVLAALTAVSTSARAERCLAIDGDTLVCNRQKVRLTNVYAAELNQPGGSAAKRRLQALVQGREVVLRAYGHDRYGRLLAEAYVDGRRIEQTDVGPRAGRALPKKTPK
jgi:micrococcal nuclease